MAFEILNNAVITPRRLHALVRLVSRLKEPKREDVQNLLQPASLKSNQDTSRAGADPTSRSVYNATRHCKLIEEDTNGIVKLMVAPDQIETNEGFQRYMQSILMGITEEQQNNYLLNLYTAWYAVQDEAVLTYTKKDFETKFNEQVDATVESREDRAFNTTKFNGWRTWAAFLGWGRLMSLGSVEILMPDATIRIEPLLDHLLPEADREIRFGSFAQELETICPELDGGKLFAYCWQASRGAERRGNNLSLMLSTALRVLHNQERIELVRQPDADQLWQLYPAMGHPVQEISHIRRRNA